MSKPKQARDCVLDTCSPLDCWVKANCKYWMDGCCRYAEIKQREAKAKRECHFDQAGNVDVILRINR